MSWWLERAAPQTQTIPRPSVPSAEAELLRVEKEFRVAERQFGDACFALARYAASRKDLRLQFTPDGITFRVNCQNMDPARTALERVRDNCRDRRNELLRQRAEVLMKLAKVGDRP